MVFYPKSYKPILPYYSMVKKLIFDLDDELDAKFRKAIIKKIGFRQGNIKQALTEAIEDWIKK